jgi:hypothetical protein
MIADAEAAADSGRNGGSADRSAAPDAEVELADAAPSPDATIAPGSADWSNCGDRKTETKAGVTSAAFCAEYATVCGFGKGAGYYASLEACRAAYEGRDVHMYSDGKRLCVAYTICAIANKTLKPALCAVPEIYRCGHRDEGAP